jgi:hypothetical protein
VGENIEIRKEFLIEKLTTPPAVAKIDNQLPDLSTNSIRYEYILGGTKVSKGKAE